MSDNYNTDPQLFINLRTSQLAMERFQRTPLRTEHALLGHVYFGSDAIARFSSTAQAEATLGMAGWFKDFDGSWVVEK